MSRLLYLPLGILSRVEFWLVYKEVKSAASSSLRFVSKGSKKIKGLRSVKRWLRDAGIEFVRTKGRPDIIHVSKNKKLADELSRKIFLKTAESDLEVGKLLGYPLEAVKAFSRLGFDRSDYSSLIDSLDKESPIRGKYWAAYARYLLRKGYEIEDSKIARLWADTIRRDIPKLAQWFEKSVRHAKYE